MPVEKFNPILLTSSKGVTDLLSSSKTKQEWDQHCDTIMAANSGQLPRFWFNVVIASGLWDQCEARFAAEEERQKKAALEEIQRQKNEIVTQAHQRVVSNQRALRQRHVKLRIKP